MRYITPFAVALALAAVQPAIGAEQTAPVTSFTGLLGQDPVFGFYPTIFGTANISQGVDFAFYGTFYTADGLGSDLGVNLFTEFGVGATFSLADGALLLTPTVGITNGVLLSGASRPVVGDGIVPALAVAWTASESFSATLGGIYWKSLRSEGPRTQDYVEWYLVPLWKVGRVVSIGFRHEVLWNTVRSGGTSTTTTTYHWLGPALRFNASATTVLGFDCGVDLVDYMNDMPADSRRIRDFYKMTASFGL